MSLSNAQYNEIMRIYSDRQMENDRQREIRKDKACAIIPGLKALDTEIREASVQAYLEKRSGNENALSELNERIRNISLQKKRLLLQAGFPEDYLDIQYHCPDCKDTGSVNGRKCHCFMELRMRYIYQQSRIENIVRRCNFDTFDLMVFDNSMPISPDRKTTREYMRELKDEMERYAASFCKESRSLVFSGNPGTGKTYMTYCLAKAIMDRNFSVVYLTSTDLFDSFAKAAFENDQEKKDTFEAVLDCDLLCIDDLGTEYPNPFTISRFFYLLNQRMLEHKATIISTNMDFDMMRDVYSYRVVSRMFSEYDVIPFYGTDLRV